MGEVHRARHLKLGRDVAIKVLPAELAGDAGRLARLEREARTASALNHPNIVTIHDIGEHDGITYIAMELVEGRTLREILGDGPLPIERVLGIATQIANALAKAHAAGIIHRDIKPANVMVTSDGLAKVLDFGLAKPLTTRDGRAIVASTLTADTQEGLLIGTPHYMSPEQLSGDPVDHRSDQFAFGVLLYEMVSGKSPFDGPSLRAVISAIIANSPPALRKLRPDVPADLERIVNRCLEKDPAKRYATTAELADALRRCESRRTSDRQKLASFLRKPTVIAAAALIAVAIGIWGWQWSRGSEERWARTKALPQIASLTETGDLYGAYRTARRAEKHLADHTDLNKLVQRITLPVRVNTKPDGAEVWVKGYATPDAAWEPVGVTPLELRIPYALMRWRITKEGYAPFEGAPLSASSLRALAEGLILDSLGRMPTGAVRIPAGALSALPGMREEGVLPGVQVPTFFLDRYEVTNRLFKEFVDAGAYEKPEHWPPFERDGKTIPWQEAMSAFRDATGRPGPSTWEAGSYAAGEDEHPVSGISWYEAVAFCAFAGKTLPTIFHWFRAIGQDQFSDILNHSNVNGQDKAAVGAFKGVSGFGTYDMAGNVKEWTWNASGTTRFILGGAWNEPGYLFRHLIAQDPWGRDKTYGMRCAKYPEAPAEQLTGPVTPMRKYAIPAPITDDAFALLRGTYAYDPTPLEAEVVRVNDSLPAYRRETVSMKTAYGNERMEVHLLIPRDATPPYQSVIWFPGGDVYMLRSSEHLSSSYLVDFIPRSGRVLVQIVYENMYERFDGRVETPGTLRDLMVRWSQDIGRTIDYLETRADFDASKVAYYALSGGAIWGVVLTAIEERFAASILLGGGLVPVPYRREMHPALFAPRSRTPTLMINGRDDFLMPYDMSQRALFTLLGTPSDRKRHALLDGGHIPTDRREVMREVLDWLDAQLGPVRRTTSVARATQTP